MNVKVSPEPVHESVAVEVDPVYTIKLPANYPTLPFNDRRFQPVAYNQANGSEVHVTVLIPLPPDQKVVPSTTIDKQDDGSVCFTYNIELRKLDNANAFDTLAYFKFSFPPNLPERIQSFKLTITIGAELGSDELGKVVMDSNMFPTNPK